MLKPWVLEVNIFPSLSSSSPFDKRIKTKLIADVFTLVGFPPCDHNLVDRAVKEERISRRQGLAPRPGPTKSHTLATVSSVASLKEFGEAEWSLIVDTHDEFMRRGSLRRIFPTKEGVGRFLPFFPSPRYSNLVLARWLELGGECCFRQEGRREVPPWVPKQICFDPC